MTTSCKDENKVWPDTVWRQFSFNEVYCECDMSDVTAWYHTLYHTISFQLFPSHALQIEPSTKSLGPTAAPGECSRHLSFIKEIIGKRIEGEDARRHSNAQKFSLGLSYLKLHLFPTTWCQLWLDSLGWERLQNMQGIPIADGRGNCHLEMDFHSLWGRRPPSDPWHPKWERREH